jgi:hypothetical protein
MTANLTTTYGKETVMRKWTKQNIRLNHENQAQKGTKLQLCAE